jgi:magnesium chelatase family protein
VNLNVHAVFSKSYPSIITYSTKGGRSLSEIPTEKGIAEDGARAVGLFLEELRAFRRGVLEVMRQPLEDSHVTIARTAMTSTFSTRFMLTAAMNP